MSTQDEKLNFEMEDYGNTDDFAGYSVVQAEDVNAERVENNSNSSSKKIEENYDDGKIVEATPILADSQIVIIDKPKVAGLVKGDSLTIAIKSEKSVLIFNDDKKIGELRQAFCQKLFDTRKGMYAQCFFHEAEPIAMISLKFSQKSKKDSIKIELPK